MLALFYDPPHHKKTDSIHHRMSIICVFKFQLCCDPLVKKSGKKKQTSDSTLTALQCNDKHWMDSLFRLNRSDFQMSCKMRSQWQMKEIFQRSPLKSSVKMMVSAATLKCISVIYRDHCHH